MKITLESTSRIVEIQQPGGSTLPARVWEGRTEGGVACYALITQIAAHSRDDRAEFERDLQVCKPPSTGQLEAIPFRFFLD